MCQYLQLIYLKVVINCLCRSSSSLHLHYCSQQHLFRFGSENLPAHHVDRSPSPSNFHLRLAGGPSLFLLLCELGQPLGSEEQARDEGKVRSKYCPTLVLQLQPRTQALPRPSQPQEWETLPVMIEEEGQVGSEGNRGRRHQTWQKRWTPATRRRWFQESQRRCSSTM